MSPPSSPSREITKSVINKPTGRAREILTSSTEEEVEACYPIIDILNHVVNPGLEASCDLKINYVAKSASVGSADASPVEESSEDNAKNLLDAMLAGAFTGNFEVIDQSIRSGADITQAEASGRNALHYCATGGHHALLQKVIKKLRKVCGEDDELFKSCLNKRDGNGWSPLAIAVCRAHMECVTVLLDTPGIDATVTLEHSCPPSRGQERSRSSVLHLAAVQCQAPIMLKLIEKGGLEPTLLDSQNRNIFHYLAAAKNAMQGVAAINVLFATKKKQDAAAELAGSSGAAPAATTPVAEVSDLSDEEVAGKGSTPAPKRDSFVEALLLRDNSQHSPLFVAAAYGNEDILMAMLRYLSQQAKGCYSLRYELIESTDNWSMSAIQVAYLRKQYRLIDKLGDMWGVFRNPEKDESELHEAICSVYNIKLTDGLCSAGPTVIIKRVLENPDTWINWLKADLTFSETTCYNLVKSILAKRGLSNDESCLLRAVRCCGPDMCCLVATRILQGGHGDFFTELRTVLNEEHSPLEANALWKYINAESIVSKSGAKPPPSSRTARAPSARVTASRPVRYVAPRKEVDDGLSLNKSVGRVNSFHKSFTTSENWMSDENIPSFMAPTKSMRNALNARLNVSKYEPNRLK